MCTRYMHCLLIRYVCCCNMLIRCMPIGMCVVVCRSVCVSVCVPIGVCVCAPISVCMVDLSAVGDRGFMERVVCISGGDSRRVAVDGEGDRV